MRAFKKLEEKVSVWNTTLENEKTQELEKWIYTHLNS